MIGDGITVALAIVAMVALGCVPLLVVWLPRELAKMVLFQQQQRDAAQKGQARAEEERHAIHEAASAEIARLVAMAYADERARTAPRPVVPLNASPWPPAAPAVETPRSAEDEARIVRRLEELVREAAAHGQDVGHCKGMDCGERGCVCGCGPCVGWQQLRAQAENDVLRGGLRAAGFGRPSASRSGVEADDATGRPAVEPTAPASAPTKVSMRAAGPVADRACPPVTVEAYR
jgi:hypothetical protein